MSESVTKIGMRPPHPGSFIRDEIPEEVHLPVARAAGILAVRRATSCDPASGRASPSPEAHALRIEKAFSVSMDTLLRIQARHDSYAMRQKAGEIEVERYEPA